MHSFIHILQHCCIGLHCVLARCTNELAVYGMMVIVLAHLVSVMPVLQCMTSPQSSCFPPIAHYLAPPLAVSLGFIIRLTLRVELTQAVAVEVAVPVRSLLHITGLRIVSVLSLPAVPVSVADRRRRVIHYSFVNNQPEPACRKRSADAHLLSEEKECPAALIRACSNQRLWSLESSSMNHVMIGLSRGRGFTSAALSLMYRCASESIFKWVVNTMAALELIRKIKLSARDGLNKAMNACVCLCVYVCVWFVCLCLLLSPPNHVRFGLKSPILASWFLQPKQRRMNMDFSQLHTYTPPQCAPENTGYTYSLRWDGFRPSGRWHFSSPPPVLCVSR